MKKITAISLLSVLGLSGCVTSAAFETEPVEVATNRGTVVCQLYTRERVLWDRAVTVPEGVTLQQGKDVCRELGQRIIDGRAGG